MDDFQAHSSIKPMGEWGGIVQYGPGDAGMIVMFYLKPVVNPARSQESGRPFYEDQVFVRIHPPGERLNIIDRRANDSDKKRWPMQWHQFKDNAPQVGASGTPVEMLFPAQPANAAALKASGVHTVEQLSELSAHAIENIGMGAQQWVNDAKRYLQVANKGVKASEMKAMLEERDRTISSQAHTIELLQAEVASLREHAAQTVTMQDVQQMIANQGGSQGHRPQFAPGKQQPFDAQTAQINATHITNDLAKASKAKPAAKLARLRMSELQNSLGELHAYF